MAIRHIIVVRERNEQVILSAEDLSMAPGEKLRWVHEKGKKGKKFTIIFKHGNKPFKSNGRRVNKHVSKDGRIDVERPKKLFLDEASKAASPADLHPVYPYTVEVKGLPPHDPKIIFETSPDEGRD